MVEQQCEELMQQLIQKTPRLCPSIIPRSVAARQRHVLSSFCVTQQQQDLLAHLIDTYEQKIRRCTFCRIKKTSDIKFFFKPLWRVDFRLLSYQLYGLAFLCKNCFTSSQLESFLSSSVGKNSKQEETECLIQHFAKTNLLQQNNSVNQTIAVQEIFSLAYALKILSSNVPNLKLVDLDGEALQEGVCPDFEQLFQRVFKPKNASKQNNSPVEKGEKKQRKRKKPQLKTPEDDDDSSPDDQPTKRKHSLRV